MEQSTVFKSFSYDFRNCELPNTRIKLKSFEYRDQKFEQTTKKSNTKFIQKIMRNPASFKQGSIPKLERGGRKLKFQSLDFSKQTIDFHPKTEFSSINFENINSPQYTTMNSTFKSGIGRNLSRSVQASAAEKFRAASRNYQKIRIPEGPLAPTSTFRAQQLAKDFLPQIPYQDKFTKFDPESIEEYKLNNNDLSSQGHKFNHIAQNKESAGLQKRHSQIEKFYKRSILNKSNERNLQAIKVNLNYKRELGIQDIMKKQRKWDEFRIKRKEIIDKYIKIKRSIIIGKGLMKMFLVSKIIMRYNQNFSQEIQLRYAENRRIWLIFQVGKLWKRQLRRRGSLENQTMHRTKIQGSYTFTAVVLNNQQRRKCLKLLKSFILDHTGIYPLIKGVQKTYKRLFMIQRKLRMQKIIWKAKVEILINFWEKLVGKIMIKAHATKDRPMIQVISKIIKIPQEIRKAVLTLFVHKCRELYQIAFFQWRRLYPSKEEYFKDNIQELIKFKIKYLFDENGNQFKYYKEIDQSQMCKIPQNIDFMRKYELVDFKDQDYRINSFEQIGWPDPFPNENTFKSECGPPLSSDQLVYTKFRFKYMAAPQNIYIPRPEMMFKMMRACVGIKVTAQLWINQEGKFDKLIYD